MGASSVRFIDQSSSRPSDADALPLRHHARRDTGPMSQDEVDAYLGSVLAALGDEVADYETSKGHSRSRLTRRCLDAWYGR